MQLEDNHPLASPIRSLFRAEQERIDRILDGLRAALQTVAPAPDAAWIQGPFATEQDRPGDPITVGVLARSDTLQHTLDGLREALTDLESAEDVTVEIKGFTRPDIAVARQAELKQLADALPLFGPPPAAFTKLPKEHRVLRNVLVHGDKDHQQLLLAREIAQRIVNDPAKLEAAKEYVRKRLRTASAHERHELKEWDALLRSTSTARLAKLLLDPGERATRLRQTMPFLYVLTPEERDEVLARARSS